VLIVAKRDVTPCVPVFHLKLFLVLIVANNFVIRSYYSPFFILLEAFPGAVLLPDQLPEDSLILLLDYLDGYE
jgi:hypothetical protein